MAQKRSYDEMDVSGMEESRAATVHGSSLLPLPSSLKPHFPLLLCLRRSSPSLSFSISQKPSLPLLLCLRPLLFSVPVAADLAEASPPAAQVSPRLSSSACGPFAIAAEVCSLSVP